MPPDWQLGTVSEIIELHDSKRIPLSSRERANLTKIYPYYGATSVMDYVDRYLFDGIYLLLGEDGTVVDDKGFPILQYVEGKFWVNNHAHIITGKNGFTVETLYLLFSLTNVRSIVTGAVQPKISQANLNNVSVVIPSKVELSTFNSIVQPIFSQIRNLRAESDRLTSTRDILLPRLMSGEIDAANIQLYAAKLSFTFALHLIFSLMLLANPTILFLSRSLGIGIISFCKKSKSHFPAPIPVTPTFAIK